MTVLQILTLIGSSSIIATFLSAIINQYFKKIEFRNDYYKIIIQKRIEAYENIEAQIQILKVSILDESDGKSYHRIFYSDEYFNELTSPLLKANSNSLWINKKTNEKLIQLLHIFNKVRFENKDDLTEAGKKYYWEIAYLRDDLENLVRNDLLKLYDFKDIKQKNNKVEGYQFIECNNKK